VREFIPHRAERSRNLPLPLFYKEGKIKKLTSTTPFFTKGERQKLAPIIPPLAKGDKGGFYCSRSYLANFKVVYGRAKCPALRGLCICRGNS
jgi:hypothetical protein